MSSSSPCRGFTSSSPPSFLRGGLEGSLPVRPRDKFSTRKQTARVERALPKKQRVAAAEAVKKSKFAKRREASKAKKEKRAEEMAARRESQGLDPSFVAPLSTKAVQAAKRKRAKAASMAASAAAVSNPLQSDSPAAKRVPRLDCFYHENVVCATRPGEWPRQKFPQVCVVGRTNAGKSSMLNHLFRGRKLARTSSRPGVTTSLDFYDIDHKVPALFLTND